MEDVYPMIKNGRGSSCKIAALVSTSRQLRERTRSRLIDGSSKVSFTDHEAARTV